MDNGYKRPLGSRSASGPPSTVPTSSELPSQRRNSSSDESSGPSDSLTRWSDEPSATSPTVDSSKPSADAGVEAEEARQDQKDNTKPRMDSKVGPFQREFEADPAHQFWKWSKETQNWFHRDECTGSVLWAPQQLD
ncbi:hypothetical protein CCHR01_06632 [Colletotrichum chrysophilum]|uniref:Uncharacterized protein n=1 Tax=Colletotrichum chrysophilum TaxID=1836956 RepID=A0AAD9AM50_9PEZI|nr:hypothetical protein CCHR01_06632 [Colletotrichum chrysophilum]